MPEIGTSGLMSGDGKRGGAQRQYPRPSSTLPRDLSHASSRSGTEVPRGLTPAPFHAESYRPRQANSYLPRGFVSALGCIELQKSGQRRGISLPVPIFPRLLE